ncbi:hypothetical protein M3Y94_01249200 [Aphelenchoides besseyi]|nr:hypothetical protein M3Y94_01249200 [Aphelenchoides besseyi]KAI6219393.1 hypothetical protein M3Y95_01106400 [Aphelenchoides besseyi]
MSTVILTILLASLVYSSFASTSKECPGCLPKVTCSQTQSIMGCISAMDENAAKKITKEALDEYPKHHPNTHVTLKKYIDGRAQLVAGSRYWLELTVLSYPKFLLCGPTTKQLNVTAYQGPGADTKLEFKFYELPNFDRCGH